LWGRFDLSDSPEKKLFFRMIYETRPREVLEARIELWNRNTGEITFRKILAMLGFTRSTGYAILCIPKGKYNRWTRRYMPRIMKLTGNTSAAALCGEKGHIFINGRTGKRLTLRHFEKMIDKWAAEHPEIAVHQAQREGVSSDHVNGTKGRQERGHYPII
jgi:hypothetical protein